MKNVGKWWNDDNINLVEIDGNVYALHGWNGEGYYDCRRVFGDYNMESSKENYILTPIYQQNEEDDFRIIDYEITKGIA